MTKKLNKNQRAFFEDAINHFRLRSSNVKYGDLKAFAITNGLILPTSFLKNHCKTGEHGWYDLRKSDVADSATLADIDPAWTDEAITEDEPVETVVAPLIVEQSAFAEDVTMAKTSMASIANKFKIDHEWTNPVYVITDVDGDVRHVCDSPVTAHSKIENLLHSGHSMTKEQVLTALDEYGNAVIKSTNSQLKAVIEVFDFNK